MDFLMLLPGRQRIVIEVDGKHHFSEGDRRCRAFSRLARNGTQNILEPQPVSYRELWMSTKARKGGLNVKGGRPRQRNRQCAHGKEATHEMVPKRRAQCCGCQGCRLGWKAFTSDT